jgi:hypothetical protein
MTLLLLHSEFPYEENFLFFFISVEIEGLAVTLLACECRVHRGARVAVNPPL